MPEVELVIKMSEEEYKKIIEDGECDYLRVINAIENGALLPEEHGDLVDRKSLCDSFWDNRSKLYTHKDLQIAIEKADAIIKADNKDEVEENFKEPEEDDIER